MGKRIRVQLPDGTIKEVYVSNNPEVRAKAEAQLEKQYGVRYDLKKGARKEREYDQARQAMKEEAPDYAKKVKNYENLSYSARMKLYKASPEFRQYEKDKELYQAQKAIYDRGLAQAQAIEASQKPVYKVTSNQSFIPKQQKQVTPAQKVAAGFKSGELNTKQTLAELKSLKQQDIDVRNRNQATAFEKRVAGIESTEAKIAAREEKILDYGRKAINWLDSKNPLVTKWEKGEFGKEARAYAITAPIHWPLTYASGAYVAGKKIAATGEGLVKGSRSGVAGAYKEAEQKVDKAVFSGLDPRTPEGLVNLIGVGSGAYFSARTPMSHKMKVRLAKEQAKQMKAEAAKAAEPIKVNEKGFFKRKYDEFQAKRKTAKRDQFKKEKIVEAEYKMVEPKGESRIRTRFKQFKEARRAKKPELPRELVKSKTMPARVKPSRKPPALRQRERGITKSRRQVTEYKPPKQEIKVAEKDYLPAEPAKQDLTVAKGKTPTLPDAPKPSELALSRPRRPGRPQKPVRPRRGTTPKKGGGFPFFGDLPDFGVDFSGGGGGGWFGGRRTKGKGRKTKYLPSLSAITFNIKGKKPGTITGLEMRPIIK